MGLIIKPENCGTNFLLFPNFNMKTRTKILLFLWTVLKIVSLFYLDIIWQFVFIGVSLSTILLYLIKIHVLKRQERKEQREIRDTLVSRVDERIWEIPVNINCRHCSSPEEISFSLETQGFQCKNCGGWNKLFLQFMAIGESKTSISEKGNGQ